MHKSTQRHNEKVPKLPPSEISNQGEEGGGGGEAGTRTTARARNTKEGLAVGEEEERTDGCEEEWRLGGCAARERRKGK